MRFILKIPDEQKEAYCKRVNIYSDYTFMEKVKSAIEASLMISGIEVEDVKPRKTKTGS